MPPAALLDYLMGVDCFSSKLGSSPSLQPRARMRLGGGSLRPTGMDAHGA